jgi:hypothetical protein
LNLIAMLHNDAMTLPVAPLNECISAALCQLNTIKDLLIATEGKLGAIDGQFQAMTGNQWPQHINMTMPPMGSQQHQP